MFDNKTILITGGTGSFGKQMTRTLLDRYKVNKIIIYSRDELKQFDMRNEFDDPKLRFFIGDVRDGERLKMAVKGVDIIIHAAALKQVPAAEYNPMECIKTNVLGAQNVIDAAISHAVPQTIALSTDKAANPINLYGATKLTSDKLFVAANNLVGFDNIAFSVVRYGNVLNSRGSVIPFFRSLVEEGSNYLPVTHAKMTRFFLTLQQGVDFVLDCFLRMKGGEIFIPKIPSASILELAEIIGGDLPIKITGLRPGEKLHEVMIPTELSSNAMEFEGHYIIKPDHWFRCVNYHTDRTYETGVPVREGFEYASNNNAKFLSYKELECLINQ